MPGFNRDEGGLAESRQVVGKAPDLDLRCDTDFRANFEESSLPLGRFEKVDGSGTSMSTHGRRGDVSSTQLP